MWCQSNTFSWTNEKRTNFNEEHFRTLIRVRTERNLFQNKPVIKAINIIIYATWETLKKNILLGSASVDNLGFKSLVLHIPR